MALGSCTWNSMMHADLQSWSWDFMIWTRIGGNFMNEKAIIFSSNETWSHIFMTISSSFGLWRTKMGFKSGKDCRHSKLSRLITFPLFIHSYNFPLIPFLLFTLNRCFLSLLSPICVVLKFFLSYLQHLRKVFGQFCKASSVSWHFGAFLLR